MFKFSILVMLLHSLKLGMFILSYLREKYGIDYVAFIEFLQDRQDRLSGTVIATELAFIDDYIEGLMGGSGRGVELPAYGDIYWDAEEACFLRIVEQKARFYREIETLLRRFLDERGLVVDDQELDDVLRYQEMRVPSYSDPERTERVFSSNMPEYMDRLFGNSPTPLSPSRQRGIVEAKAATRDPVEFARQVVLWGRKSGAILNDCKWVDLETRRSEPLPLRA